MQFVRCRVLDSPSLNPRDPPGRLDLALHRVKLDLGLSLHTSYVFVCLDESFYIELLCSVPMALEISAGGGVEKKAMESALEAALQDEFKPTAKPRSDQFLCVTAVNEGMGLALLSIACGWG